MHETRKRKTVLQRLEGYFGSPLRFKVIPSKPIWQLVDEIKEVYPGWPNKWE